MEVHGYRLMIYLAQIGWLAVVLGVLWDHSRARKEWAVERHSLLNRIQHPRVFQAESLPELEQVEPVDDELALIGSIQYDGGE